MRTLLLLTASLLLLASGAEAQTSTLGPYHAPYYVPYGCSQSVQLFNSLKYGDFDFCRLKLRYQPGRAECLRIIVSTCNLVVPGTRIVSPGGLEGFAERIECPRGPPPPSCPSGYYG
jgi:hypothetical protein